MQSLQTVVGSNMNPLHAAVLCVTRFKAGSAYYVIPETAHLAGTNRTFDAQARSLALARLSEICTGIAAAYGAGIDVTIRDVLSFLENCRSSPLPPPGSPAA